MRSISRSALIVCLSSMIILCQASEVDGHRAKITDTLDAATNVNNLGVCEHNCEGCCLERFIMEYLTVSVGKSEIKIPFEDIISIEFKWNLKNSPTILAKTTKGNIDGNNSEIDDHWIFLGKTDSGFDFKLKCRDTKEIVFISESTASLSDGETDGLSRDAQNAPGSGLAKSLIKNKKPSNESIDMAENETGASPGSGFAESIGHRN